MKIIVKLFLIFIVSISFLLLGSKQYLKKKMQAPVITDTQMVFEIKPGQSFKTITKKLEQQKVVKNAFWIYWYSRTNKLSNKIKAGEYLIQPGMSNLELLNQLIIGKVKQYNFTIVEGWTFKELINNIKDNNYLFNDIDKLSEKELKTIIDLKDKHPEGQFLPETYAFTKGATVSSVLIRAHKDLQKVLHSAWQEKSHKTPLKSPYEVLILASIVEKETGVTAERPLIAGVFINRLNKGMRLQTDPTVIYGMGDSYKGDIRFKDLRNYTPYNTYKIKGLPPTPIAMPGKAAIHAVLNSTDTKALYFVSTGNGKHLFSETLEAHNKAVDKYQRKRKALDKK